MEDVAKRFKWTDLRVWLSTNLLVLHKNKLGLGVPVIPVNKQGQRHLQNAAQRRLIIEAVPPSLPFRLPGRWRHADHPFGCHITPATVMVVALWSRCCCNPPVTPHLWKGGWQGARGCSSVANNKHRCRKTAERRNGEGAEGEKL